MMGICYMMTQFRAASDGKSGGRGGGERTIGPLIRLNAEQNRLLEDAELVPLTTGCSPTGTGLACQAGFRPERRRRAWEYSR
jgi:hypothetical protein